MQEWDAVCALPAADRPSLPMSTCAAEMMRHTCSHDRYGAVTAMRAATNGAARPWTRACTARVCTAACGTQQGVQRHQSAAHDVRQRARRHSVHLHQVGCIHSALVRHPGTRVQHRPLPPERPSPMAPHEAAVLATSGPHRRYGRPGFAAHHQRCLSAP